MHPATRVERGEARGQPGPGRRTVEPARGDHDRVLRDAADALPRLRDLDDAHAGDPGVLRVHHGQLLAGGGTNQLADPGQVTGLRGHQLEAERSRIGDGVPHAAVRHVNRQRAEPLDLQRRVQPVGETRDVLELHPLDLAVPAAGRDVDRATGRLEAERRHRLDHLDHAGLEQDRRDADRVRTGHRGVLGRLHDHVAEGAVGARRRQDHVRVDRDTPARLVEEQPADRVVRSE
jgi:hypothetical protein